MITGGQYGTVSSTLLSLPEKFQRAIFQYAAGPPSNHSYDDLSALLRQVLSTEARAKELAEARELKEGNDFLDDDEFEDDYLDDEEFEDEEAEDEEEKDEEEKDEEEK